MDSYEQGFLAKCAELGVDGRPALGILKLAFDPGLRQAEEEYRRQYGTEPLPMSKAAYDSILKRAESSDPNLQRASEIFKDWLTTRKHTVRSGEVLSGIARKYNVPMEEIMKENNMNSILGIRPGQQIKIPVAQNSKKV